MRREPSDGSLFAPIVAGEVRGEADRARRRAVPLDPGPATRGDAAHLRAGGGRGGRVSRKPSDGSLFALLFTGEVRGEADRARRRAVPLDPGSATRGDAAHLRAGGGRGGRVSRKPSDGSLFAPIVAGEVRGEADRARRRAVPLDPGPATRGDAAHLRAGVGRGGRVSREPSDGSLFAPMFAGEVGGEADRARRRAVPLDPGSATRGDAAHLRARGARGGRGALRAERREPLRAHCRWGGEGRGGPSSAPRRAPGSGLGDPRRCSASSSGRRAEAG